MLILFSIIFFLIRMHVSRRYKIWIKIVKINNTHQHYEMHRLSAFSHTVGSGYSARTPTPILNPLSILIFFEYYNLHFIKSRSIQSIIFPQANYYIQFLTYKQSERILIFDSITKLMHVTKIIFKKPNYER